MITIENVMTFLTFEATQQNKSVPHANDVETYLDSINQEAIIESWKSRIKVQIWDGKSDINTASAEYIKKSSPWLDVVYCLTIDGSIVFMQTHDPFQQGWIPVTELTVADVSQAHANQIAEESAHSQIYTEVLNYFGLVV